MHLLLELPSMYSEIMRSVGGVAVEILEQLKAVCDKLKLAIPQLSEEPLLIASNTLDMSKYASMNNITIPRPKNG